MAGVGLAAPPPKNPPLLAPILFFLQQAFIMVIWDKGGGQWVVRSKLGEGH